MAVSVGMDEINRSGSKMPHKRELHIHTLLLATWKEIKVRPVQKLDGFNDNYNPNGYVHIFALCFYTVANSLLVGISDRGMQSFQ